MRKLLLPFSILYWLGVVVRNWFFDIGILKTSKAGVPVISVGNISAGGAGKTPVVEMLIEMLGPNRKLAVVSRGYGRKSSGSIVVNDGKGKIASVENAGDESSQIAGKFPGTIVLVDEKRVRGAQKARELGAEIIILDDGFQHRYLFRDLNIAVMTADEILGYDRLIPAGNRREPLSSLKRADELIITRCRNHEQFENASEKIRQRFQRIEISGLMTIFKTFRRALTGEKIMLKELKAKKVIAVSGIGRPASFELSLLDAGISIVKHLKYPDHHWFSGEDIKTIKGAKEEFEADYILTTEKDFMRLKDGYRDFLKKEPVIVAEIQQAAVAGIDKLEKSIKQLISRKKNSK